MFNYVRRIDDNTKIKCYGYCDFMGQFPEDEYEQISCEGEHEMPQGWEFEVIKSPSEKLNDIIMDLSSDDDKKEVLKIKYAILDASVCGCRDVADALIDETSLSQQIKDDLKACY